MASRVVHLSPIQWLHWSVAVNHRLSIRKFKLGECRELEKKNTSMKMTVLQRVESWTWYEES